MKIKKQKQKQHKDKILNSIPIFLAKTYRIVDNPQYADTIEWIPQQNGFIVKNISDLTEKIFPKHFKHTNYASFVRQLNLYGFHKIRSNDEGHIFAHNYFQKNNPDLLPLIKRKNALPTQTEKLQKSQQLVLRHTPSNLFTIPSPQPNKEEQYEKQLGLLTQKHESLQNLVSMLVEQNKQIIMQNKSFINKINSIDDGYRKKLQTLIFLMVFGLKNGQNIIMPQQLNNMIKAFTSGKKQIRPKVNNNNNINNTNNNQNNSQAVQLFKRPNQDQSRFNNKNIEQILQMLKMESSGEEISDGEEQQHEDHHLESLNSLNSLNLNLLQSKSHNLQEHLQSMQQVPQLSPIPSMQQSVPYKLNDEKMPDDWNDFLEKLENDELHIQNCKD